MSGVLVDSSVWIEFFRNSDADVSLVLDELLKQNAVLICGLIKAELIPFAPSKKKRRQLAHLLNSVPELPQFNTIWDKIEEHQTILRENGILHINIPDLIIAATCIEFSVPLFTLDKHFKMMQPVLPLQLFEYQQ